MAAIHIGMDHLNIVAQTFAGGRTHIITGASALCTGNGIIQTAYAVWRYSTETNDLYFGIFYPSAGGFTCRSAAGPFALGGAGVKSYAVNLAAQLNDIWGIYWGGGNELRSSNTNPVSCQNAIGNKCVVGLESSFPSSYNSHHRTDGDGISFGAYETGGIMPAKRITRGFGW